MRRLSVAVGLFVALAWAPIAAAAETPKAALRWELGPELGYARSFTNGLSYLDATVGLTLDYQAFKHFQVGGSLLHHAGSRVSAEGPGTRYHANLSANSLDGRVGWTFWVADRLVLRPGFSFGVTAISGTTEVLGLPRSNARLSPSLGPMGTILVRLDQYFIGVEGDARFVPNQVGGPFGAVYGIFRARL